MSRPTKLRPDSLKESRSIRGEPPQKVEWFWDHGSRISEIRLISNFFCWKVHCSKFLLFWFFGSCERRATEIQTDFHEDVGIFAIFSPIVDVLAGPRFLRWVAQSRELLRRFLFRYSDPETDTGNYLNEVGEVRKNRKISQKVEEKIFDFFSSKKIFSLTSKTRFLNVLEHF